MCGHILPTPSSQHITPTIIQLCGNGRQRCTLTALCLIKFSVLQFVLVVLVWTFLLIVFTLALTFMTITIVLHPFHSFDYYHKTYSIKVELFLVVWVTRAHPYANTYIIQSVDWYVFGVRETLPHRLGLLLPVGL